MRSPQFEPARFPLREGEFVTGMALLMALQALAIDVMLPALGRISTDLGVSDPNDRQLVVGVFLVSSGLASLLPGSIADRFGRKPVILGSLVAYVVISLASAFVTDFTMLLVLRALLGVCTAGLMVMPMAVVRDRFSGDRMARTQSLIAVVFMAVPMVAPVLGQAIIMVASWRWIFAIMGILGLLLTIWTWLRLPETLHPDHRQAIAPRAILANMRFAVTHRAAAGYILGAALIHGALFGYINSAQQLVAEALGAGAAFPLIFGGMALLMAGANFINATIVERFGARRVSHSALIVYTLLACVHLYFAATDIESLWTFVPLMAGSMCLMSFIGANFQAISLQPFAHMAGAAASALAFVRMVVGSLLGMWIGRLFDGSSVPLTISMAAAGGGALLLVLYSEHGRLFRPRAMPHD